MTKVRQGAEDAVHGSGPGLQDGPDLLAVDQLGHGSALVADQEGNLLQRYAAVGQQQDVAYLARELPRAHAGGLTGVSRPAWLAAARRLQRQVPQLTDGQVIVGMARMVAMLGDDETQLILPPSAVYPFAARWIGNDIYLLGVPAADRWLLGARLAAVDGHPVRQVVARLRPLIDHQDRGIAQGWIVNWGQVTPRWPGYLTDADLLHWLGVTRSATAAEFTVVTTHGSRRMIRLTAAGGPGGASLPQLRYVPYPLYLRRAAEPYWLRILARQRAIYLRYNHCLPGPGFGQLAARALKVLRAHPAYRLVVDLRENGGGDSEPFGPLVSGIWDDPAINVRGRIFCLVNDFTASAATLDSYLLRLATNALLIGQQAADPVQEFGNGHPLRLPHSALRIQVTRTIVNPAQTRHGIPDIVVAPTLADWLAGRDPVLAKALAYGRNREP